MDKYSRTSIIISPTRIIVSGFIFLIITGSVLLTLPFCTKDNTISFIDALFTATSASCVTGLSIYDTYTKFTFIGQLIILIMIQIGGLGLVSFTTFFSIITRKKLGFKALRIACYASGADNVSTIKNLYKSTFKIVFLCEVIGTIALLPIFVINFGFLNGLWFSIFTSISAFCNAGFELMGVVQPYSSLSLLYGNLWVNIVITSLIICGGLGFVVWNEILIYYKTKELSFNSKIILLFTFIFVVIGTVNFLIFEYNNPLTIGNMKPYQKILCSFFQSVTCRTAGFSTINQSQLNVYSKLFSCFLMFTGCAPTGTGGGIKITTFAVVIITVSSILKGKTQAVFLNHKIQPYTVYKAITVVVISLSIVLFNFFILYSTSSYSSIDCLYESISAFSTTGLSVGISTNMNLISKLSTSLCMFLGRVGPISIAISLYKNYHDFYNCEIYPDGKIIVG